MSVNAAKLRVTLHKTLSFILVMFGVCSVSIEAYGYTQSPRDTPTKSQKVVEAPAKTPFSPGSQNLSLGVGQVFLFGALGNSYDNAIGPEIHYAYGVSDLFAFESNFGYHSHARANTNLSIWNLAAGLRSNLMYFDQLVPYVNVDLGFYHPSFTYANNGQASTTLFGLQLGTGIDLIISNNVFFGAALTYNDMFDSTKTDSNGNIQSLGGAYVSFMIHAGVTF
jgi:opacity protein-like surface antigen